MLQFVLALLILGGFGMGFILGASGLLGLHRRLSGAHAAAQLALNRLEAECGKRGDLLARLMDAARVSMHRHRDVFEEVLECRNAMALAVGEVVARPSEWSGFHRWHACERALEGAFEGFRKAVLEYPELRSARNVLQIAGELESVWERVELFERAYNECSGEFNDLWNGVFSGLVARFLGYTPMPVLEAKAAGLGAEMFKASPEVRIPATGEPPEAVQDSVESRPSGSRVFYG